MDKAGPSSKKNDIIFIAGNKGKGRLPNQGMVILHAGHKYNFVKTSPISCTRHMSGTTNWRCCQLLPISCTRHMSGTTNWRCCNKNVCSTSITLSKNNEIFKEVKHVCLPVFERNRNDFTLSCAKKEACQNMEPIPKIFEKYYNHPSAQNDMLSPEELPLFSSKKDTLYRARYKYLKVKKSKFNSPQDVQLPDSLVNNFFLFDEGFEEKIIIFGSQLAKATLKKVNVVYVDGTFRCCPAPFYQLFSLHVDVTHESETVGFVPLIFALLPNKSQSTYERLFKILKEQFSLDISIFKCDYELAIIQAIKSIYPDVTVKGCYYHFTNAVWKKSKCIGFSSSAEGRKYTKMFSLLALLPPVLIPEAYLLLCELVPKTKESSSFIDYFNRQWITLITKEIFSCYGEKFRTTNAIEGWHKRINARIPKKPSLFHFITLLKIEANAADVKIVCGGYYCAGKNRRRSDILIDSQIEHIFKDTQEYKIPLLECLQRLAVLRRV